MFHVTNIFGQIYMIIFRIYEILTHQSYSIHKSPLYIIIISTNPLPLISFIITKTIFNGKSIDKCFFIQYFLQRGFFIIVLDLRLTKLIRGCRETASTCFMASLASLLPQQVNPESNYLFLLCLLPAKQQGHSLLLVSYLPDSRPLHF